MTQKILKLSIVLFLGLGLTGLQAQEAIPASGGEASGTGGTTSYSIGQVVYTINTGTNGSVAEGLQQPYEISMVTGIEQAKEINLLFSAYPNPVTDFLILKVESHDNVDLLYLLFDINGKLLGNKKVVGNETSIAMKHLVPATYFLKITKNNKEVKILKIIKN